MEVLKQLELDFSENKEQVEEIKEVKQENHKKSEQEREALHRAIWQLADSMRGSVDGWDFKQYVLGMMFYRYISENLTNYVNEGEEEGFDYAQMSDEDAEIARAGLVNEKGFFILPSELFCNVCTFNCDNKIRINIVF